MVTYYFEPWLVGSQGKRGLWHGVCVHYLSLQGCWDVYPIWGYYLSHVVGCLGWGSDFAYCNTYKINSSVSSFSLCLEIASHTWVGHGATHKGLCNPRITHSCQLVQQRGLEELLRTRRSSAGMIEETFCGSSKRLFSFIYNFICGRSDFLPSSFTLVWFWFSQREDFLVGGGILLILQLFCCGVFLRFSFVVSFQILFLFSILCQSFGVIAFNQISLVYSIPDIFPCFWKLFNISSLLFLRARIARF